MTTAPLLACISLATVSIVALVACSERAAPPTQLVDGSRAAPSHVAFENVDAPVLATVARRRSVDARCDLEVGPDAVVVERVGVSGASVTAWSPRERIVRACDRTTAGSPCGHAFTRLRPAGQLDPRLSLTCTDSDGARVGFAWIAPGARTTYVVVAHAQHAEAYRVLAGAPVRITTHDVDLATSSARFDVSEHAADGRRLDSYFLVARVAG